MFSVALIGPDGAGKTTDGRHVSPCACWPAVGVQLIHPGSVSQVVLAGYALARDAVELRAAVAMALEPLAGARGDL